MSSTWYCCPGVAGCLSWPSASAATNAMPCTRTKTPPTMRCMDTSSGCAGAMTRARAGTDCGSCLLGNLLDHPEEEVGNRLFDPEPFELGGDLAAVAGRVTDNVAPHRPPRQGESAADRAQRQQDVEPLRRERGARLL